VGEKPKSVKHETKVDNFLQLFIFPRRISPKLGLILSAGCSSKYDELTINIYAPDPF